MNNLQRTASDIQDYSGTIVSGYLLLGDALGSRGVLSDSLSDLLDSHLLLSYLLAERQ